MPVYRAASPDTLRIVPLDAFTLVYHRASGITHLLGAPAPDLLAVLQAGPADAATALARLTARFEIADASEAAVAARLDELVAAGLVATA